MKVIKIYSSNDVQLIVYEDNGHINTMPIKYFKRKYNAKTKRIN